MTHSYRAHYFHIVWGTRNREKWITPEIQPDLYNYINGIIRNYKGALLKAGGMSDHIHLLIGLNVPSKFIEIIRDVKSYSTTWIRKNNPNHAMFAWQEGYGSFSVSYSGIENVLRYIENQEEHHKIMTFETEYISLLKKHHIVYDERFVL
ncbi:MAG: IS200/IS605 family transposase [Proteobacteria bacterium]|nr:IS200/IS605 family transposase [Pseudomonadota bacterium]